MFHLEFKHKEIIKKGYWVESPRKEWGCFIPMVTTHGNFVFKPVASLCLSDGI